MKSREEKETSGKRVKAMKGWEKKEQGGDKRPQEQEINVKAATSRERREKEVKRYERQ